MQMQEYQIALINLSQPSVSLNFTYNKQTTILDLHQFITKNIEKGRIEIYFVENQLFQGNLNFYLFKQIKGNQLYFKIDISQKQIQSQYGNSIQDNNKILISQNTEQNQQSLSLISTNKHQKFEKSCQTDQNQSQINVPSMNQDQNMQQIKDLKSQIQELTKELLEKKRSLENKENYERQFNNQNQQYQQYIYELQNENNQLKQQLYYLQNKNQEGQKENESLKNELDSLKNALFKLNIENKANNQKIKQNNQFLQSQGDFQLELNDTDHELIITYKNKCGHEIEKDKLQQLLSNAVKNKNIVRCQFCNSHFSSKLCLEIGTIGKEYLQMIMVLQLPFLKQNCKDFKNQNLNVLTCENSNCKYFCIWQPHLQNLYGDYSFCPNCLKQTIKSQKKTELYNTQV